MTSFYQEPLEEDILKQKVGSVTSSSPPSTNILPPSEAFALSKIEKRTGLEFEVQIGEGLENSGELNQEKKLWKQSEEELLLELHDRYGNKWTNIALQFPGRDHNSVKNHFYAQIRKSLRRINYFMKQNGIECNKQLNINHISKMITLFSQKNDKYIILEPEKIQQIEKLKRYLFAMGKREQSETLENEVLQEMKEQVRKMNDLLQEVKVYSCASKQQKKNKTKYSNGNKNQKQEARKMKIMKKDQSSQLQTKNNLPHEKTLKFQEYQNGINSQCFIMFYCWNNQVFPPTSYFDFNMMNQNQQYRYPVTSIFESS